MSEDNKTTEPGKSVTAPPEGENTGNPKRAIPTPSSITAEVKTLDNTNIKEAKANDESLQIYGDGDMWQLLCKVSSKKERWIKSTKALQTPHGCLVQVTSQQVNKDGSSALAEALTFVPGVKVQKDKASGGAKLIKN